MSTYLGTELSSTLKDIFDQRISTVIVATLDRDLHPHTAPFHYIVVCNPGRLRLAVSKELLTYRHIADNAYVALAVLEDGDVAVCIKGSARVVLPKMDCDCNMAVVEVEIDEIRRDNSQSHYVTQGIRIRHRDEAHLLEARKIFLELTRSCQS